MISRSFERSAIISALSCATLPSMALEDLVRYFARRRAERPDYPSLHHLAARNGWRQEDVLTFLHCQKQRLRQALLGSTSSRPLESKSREARIIDASAIVTP